MALGAQAGENRIVLPGAALAAGVAGTHWRSDLQLFNPGASAVKATVRFLRFSSTESAEESYTVEAGHLLVLEDVVSSLGTDGAGTLEITADGPILAGMRTYNRTSGGSFGQFVTPNATTIQAQAQSYGAGFLPGVIDNGAYRSNVGVFNPEGSRVSWSIDGAPMSLEPHSGWQRRVTEIASIDGEGDTLILGGTPVLSYLSVIDNHSGDPTYIPPQDAAVAGTLVGVAHQAGANGTQWRSDLFLHATEATTVLLELRPWGKSSGPSTSIELGAGETRVVHDVVGTLMGVEGGGMLTYSATHPISVSARTYTEGSKGSCGQGILPAAVMEEGYFLFLRDDEDFRSNLALYNPTGNQVGYRLEAFSADGSSLGTDTVSVPAGSAVQLNRVIHRFGLQELTAGYLEVSGGLFGGYLSFVDNASGDGSTVLPQGLAPEARVTGASVFGRIRSLYSEASEATITVIDASDWSVAARPAPDHSGRFHADLPGPGGYWIVAGTPDEMSGARWLQVGEAPVEARIVLAPMPGM
ncbi:MAG TPA: hypothetical protein ENK19_11470, partial [Acidobacteria bacterium]|nr:hypothetical protein [Acidobacteriota bacterium]